MGYEDIVNTQAKTFNGKPFANLKELVKLVDECKEDYLRFDLEYNQMVILEAKDARLATKDILLTHCIPSDRSEDLQAKQGGGGKKGKGSRKR